MRLVFSILMLIPLCLGAQSTASPVAYYPFEGNLGDATGSSANLGVPEGAVDFDCGVEGEALLLSEQGDFVRIPGGGTANVNRIFRDQDFAVSFYFKPLDGSGTSYLLSKRDEGCGTDQYFFIRYAAGERRLTVTLRQGNVEATLQHSIGNLACWQQVTFTRRATEARLFVNGEQVDRVTTPSTVDVSNEGDLLIGSNPCPSAGAGSFTGLVDDLRLYGNALFADDIPGLYAAPDRIVTADTRLFLGESIEVSVNSPCGTSFAWTPTDEIDPADAEVVTITPDRAGRRTYQVAVSNEVTSCVAVDTIELRVIDPDALDCNRLFVPRAFTPNGIGPEVNETFGIANPFAFGDLISFEIFDRYGGRMFSTADAFGRWDGAFRGQPVAPGVYLWRIAFLCDGLEVVRTGSVTVLR